MVSLTVRNFGSSGFWIDIVEQFQNGEQTRRAHGVEIVLEHRRDGLLHGISFTARRHDRQTEWIDWSCAVAANTDRRVDGLRGFGEGSRWGASELGMLLGWAVGCQYERAGTEVYLSQDQQLLHKQASKRRRRRLRLSCGIVEHSFFIMLRSSP